MHDEQRPEPLDEEEPIPGSPRSRIALAAGLLLLLVILGVLGWFVVTNTEKPEPAGMFGAGPAASAPVAFYGAKYGIV